MQSQEPERFSDRQRWRPVLLGLLAACMKEAQEMPSTERMPVVFVGHGTPRSAVWTNEWTASWEKLGAQLPRPSAILSISAHWLTRGGALVTASRQPRMNYDFYGFPEEMYKVVYPAPGNVELAQETSNQPRLRNCPYEPIRSGDSITEPGSC